ncbi:copper transporter [Mycolicibacterium sp.]|uniref:copper transporter n=1 Tax=Mycolicibacterium sp. TaxID=2320850 RepID=UPI0025CD0F3F|nr:copper transporter [Mycolicibacterium sp.]MCB9407791.1 copper transporter [Mycolicibacterium sp.]
MKSRRRRVITLAAVIVALAVGFVLGARLNSGPMLSVLRNDKGDLQQRVDALVQENRALGERLSAADDFDAAMSERMVRGALADKSVVIFRAPDAQGADVDGVVRLIGQAGGSVTGTVELTSEFINGNSGEKLRSVVNSPIVPPGTQLNTDLVDEGAQAGDLLGIALLINRDAAAEPVDDAARDTVLASLRDTGFLTYRELPGAANAAVVVTGGALAQDAGNQGATVARFAAGLAPHGAGTVLAGRAGSAAGVSAVALVRAEPNMSALVSTVDDVDAESGRITTVLALQSMIGGGPPGQYGVGAGAVSVTVRQ